ncbi:MAG: rod shape-determining protein MreC [Ferruginibacter sp.]
MRNIFLFIRRYFNFFLFLLLQGIGIYFIVHTSRYHEAAFGNFTNQVTGNINQRYSSIRNYFLLKKTNDSLVKANEALYNKLRVNYEIPYSNTKKVIDSIRVDSVLKFRKFIYTNAWVAANSVTAQNNFIVLSRGRKDKFRKGMGIVDANNSVVGIITEVSEDYSVVMSLLHKDSRISGKLFKTGETGTLNWDGKEPNIVTLSGISKSVKVARGDSVITSGFSTTFPAGLMIGRVEAAFTEPGSNNIKIKIRSSANFYNLTYVYGIENMQEEAIKLLLDKVSKQL